MSDDANAAAEIDVERIKADARDEALCDARREISRMLDGFPQEGRHTRARWAVAWLDIIIERGRPRKTCSCAPDCAERIACREVGAVGHMACGWCDDHDQARHICLCLATARPASPPPAAEMGGEG